MGGVDQNQNSVRIMWEECANEREAIRRESELLLALKPRFNRAGVWQEPKRFLGWRSQPEGLELVVDHSAGEEFTCAGPFGSVVVHIHRALVRLLWCRVHPELGLAGMPAGWFRGEHGERVLIPHDDPALVAEACQSLSLLVKAGGESFEAWLLPVTVPFEQPVRDEDLELVIKHLAGRAVGSAKGSQDGVGSAGN